MDVICKNWSYALLFVLGCGAIAGFGKTASNALLSKSFYTPPPLFEKFVFGYNDSTADLLWIRLIQDIDHCEAKQDESAPRVDCIGTELGWVYHMLNAVTLLAPKYEIAYTNGTTILSVVVHDAQGAKKMYERGLQNYPHNWPLWYNAAFLHMDQLHDSKGAAEMLLRAAKEGAPHWVYSLAANLYTKAGEAAFAKSVLETILKEHPDEKFSYRLKLRLKEIDEVLAGKQQ